MLHSCRISSLFGLRAARPSSLHVLPGVASHSSNGDDWGFLRWLRNQTHGEFVIIGRVPESRTDDRGRSRLYLAKLRGERAIADSRMTPRRYPTREEYISMLEGAKKTKYSSSCACLLVGHHQAAPWQETQHQILCTQMYTRRGWR